MADVIEITAEVRERELRLTSIPMMPSGSRNHLKIRVTFDAEWDGTSKTLVAYRDLSHPYHVPLGLDGTALIPHEVLAEQGVVYLGVFGVAGDQRITSTIVRYGVNEGAVTDGLQPSDPTPEMWEQLISAVNEVRQAAESAMRDAQTAAQGAQQSEQAAAGSATQAQGHAKSAGDSAASAAQAQRGAADAESAARQSAVQAQKSQETATQAATEAGGFARQAAGAQTAAQNSAQSAATSAQQAQQAQTAAAASATSAQASATEATKQATAAEGAAVRAENAATEVEQSAQQIDGAIDRLAIHETADGNPTVIRDSADWQMDGLRVYGQSEQVTTTGAQLLDPAKCTVAQNGYGLNVTMDGHRVTIKGASTFVNASASFAIVRYANTSLSGKGHKVKAFNVTGTGIKGIYGLRTADEKAIAVVVDTSQNQNVNTSFDIMVSEGDAAAFEPYTGGKPAPSPEYPQEIMSKTVDEIVVTGKNLVDAETLDISHYTRVSLQNRILPGVYTFSGNASTNAESDSLLISCLDTDGKLVASVYLQIGEKKSATVTIKGEVAQLQIYAARNNAAAIGKEAKISEFQSEIGSVATKYESYHAQTVKLSAPVTLRGVPVKTGGTVTIGGKQYVADRITEREGVVGVKRCTAMIGQNAGEPVDEPYISTTGALTTGASVVHTIPEEFTPLPEPDQQAIRSLRTYHGNTVVTTGAHTEVDYISDPKLYIGNKIAEISAAIVAR